MHTLFPYLLLGAFIVGIAAGVILARARYQLAEDRRLAEEENLAEVEELYAAWAAMRKGGRQPCGDKECPWK